MGSLKIHVTQIGQQRLAQSDHHRNLHLEVTFFLLFPLFSCIYAFIHTLSVGPKAHHSSFDDDQLM